MTVSSPRAPHARRGTVSAGAAFVREFIRNPSTTAAIAPSSRKLAARMIEGLDFSRMTSVVEFGPGSGVFTKAVLERLPRGWLIGEGGKGRFIAIEFSQSMAKLVREQFPRVTVVHGSAEHVEEICKEHAIGPGRLDAVVSGLGWASFPPELTTRILEATWSALRPGGEFRTFAYHVGLLMPGARHFRAEAQRLFGEVSSSRGVWANLPPAFVYRCRKQSGAM